jgi:hypothetical protein
MMKTIRYTLFLLIISASISSCTLWSRVFPPKYGCGTNGGKNVGAEKVLESNPKKIKKFKA